jgi:predicted  nucleic acid-binding Zn-ribbon protein
MIAKCPCEHCGENIEFSSDEFLSGSSVVCPHCGKETTLYVSVNPSAPKVRKLLPAKPAPQQFTAQKSNKNFLPWIVVAVLVVVCGFLAMNFSREHAQRILLENELTAAQSDAADAKRALEGVQSNAANANRILKLAQMDNQIAQDNQNVRDAVAGIYEFEKPNIGQTEVLDFRSDGSVVSYAYYTDHQNYPPIGKRTLTWTSSKNSISVTHGSAVGDDISFRPEGNDLIDEKGNRWFRIH